MASPALKGITPVISIIILLLITVALAGSAWLYISGYMEAFTYKVIDIPTGSVYFDGSNMQLLVRNMGTSTISTSPCSASGNTVTCGDITITREGGGSNPDIRPENASISPGSVVKFRDYNCLAGRIRYVISSPSSTRYIDVNADNNCAGAPAPVCGNSICSPGENCPQDNTSCTDNTCYEPTCVSGCGQILVAQGGNDEGCGSPLMCDGSGTCIECIDSDDCGAGYVCQAGNCMPGFCLTVTECANYTDQGNCTTNPCGVGEVCEWNATLGVCEEAPGECNNDADCLSKGPGFVCNTTNNQCEWTPPIGIPRPEFGIEESYRMYDNVSNRNPNLTYTQNTEGGFYTHYVDNTHPNATDTSNPYGTVDKPRKSIPGNLPPGSVVEVHSELPRTGPSGEVLISGEGTSAKPIFIRGVGNPRTERQVEIGYYGNASYIIVEGMSFFSGGIHGRIEGISFTTSHIAIRNSDFHGDENGGSLSVGSWTSNNVENIVLYNNVIHDNGVWDPDIAQGDRDIGGIGLGRASYVWIIDNEMYHNEMNGIQISGAHHIYVGRNIAHHNKQSGFWTKTAEDVIFSENTAYGHRTSSSDPFGSGMGFQYDPKRVWFLFNRIYDNTMGIASGSGNVGGREEFYFIGNVIHDVTNGFILNGLYPPEPAMLIGNTIYNVSNGIYNGYYTSKLDMINNIIADYDDAISFGSEYQTYLISNMSYNLLDGSGDIRWGSTYTNLSQFQQATGECAGCIEADPLFVDPANNNFHLQSASPAIDAGTSSGVVQQVFDRFEELYGIDIRKDIEGRTRPIDGDNNGTAEWDIGAYEHVP